MLFEDRSDAGRRLAQAAVSYKEETGVIVLALPRGGVPVAAEVADALDAPLDVLVVRKIGAPYQPELAMGAAASGGVTIINERVVQLLRIDEEALEKSTARALDEVAQKERRYRDSRAEEDVEGRIVIIVDDGVATGSTMRAAIAAVRARRAKKVVVAVPTAAVDSLRKLRPEADDVICLDTPDPYRSVGSWYRNFSQTSDEEVKRLLTRNLASAQVTS